MTIEQFTHLDPVEPKAREILKLRPEDVHDSHLTQLKGLLVKHSKSSDVEVAMASLSVLTKIDNILYLGNRSSGEIMRAANDSNYRIVA